MTEYNDHQFEEFNLEFYPNVHTEFCWCNYCKNRNSGRFILRGCLQFGDYELGEDIKK